MNRDWVSDTPIGNLYSERAGAAATSIQPCHAQGGRRGHADAPEATA